MKMLIAIILSAVVIFTTVEYNLVEIYAHLPDKIEQSLYDALGIQIVRVIALSFMWLYTAITYLSTLVPGFTDTLKYAVVAGAVTGGGLTVIANAPNPAGQSILKKYFKHGVSPARLLKSALIPTVIMGLCFMLLRF